MTKRLRIAVDRELCDAYGNCAGKAPEVFEIGEDDLMHLRVDHPSADQLNAVRAAVQSCPKGALSLVEVDD